MKSKASPCPSCARMRAPTAARNASTFAAVVFGGTVLSMASIPEWMAPLTLSAESPLVDAAGAVVLQAERDDGGAAPR